MQDGQRRAFSRPQTTLYSSVFASPSCLGLAHKCGVDSSKESYKHAAGKYGTIATLVAARELGLKFSVTTMDGAATCNKLAVLQFLHAQGCPWSSRALEAAARRGDLKFLRWAHEHGCKWDHNSILSAAASSGNVKMTAWVKQQPGVVCNWRAMNSAAAYGRTAVCEYLHAEQCGWSASVCFCAACHNHVDTLRWLHEHGCPWDAVTTAEVGAENGNGDILLYMQQEGIVFTAVQLTKMLNIADAHDNLAAAQCLRQQGAEWPTALNCSGRAWSDKAIAWARAQGCTSPT
jgi:hypothetical protein